MYNFPLTNHTTCRKATVYVESPLKPGTIVLVSSYHVHMCVYQKYHMQTNYKHFHLNEISGTSEDNQLSI